MAEQITFISFLRHSSANNARAEAGRLIAPLPLTLAETAGRPPETMNVDYLLMGPGDVRGLKPGAVRRTFPAHGALNVETDKCPYVEFAAADLPWRYSPKPNGPGLAPWLLLVVGEGAEITLLPGDRVVLNATLAAEYQNMSAKLHLLAHAQEHPGRPICRLLSPRALQPGRTYAAALVPAFNASGQFDLPANSPISCYYSWRFSTSTDAGSFEKLAARLSPLDPIPANIGLAPVAYQTAVEDAPLQPQMLVGGALVGANVPLTPEGPPPEVTDHFDFIRPQVGAAFETDDDLRPLVRLPVYGQPWLPAGAETEPLWMKTLNDDPRLRGIAGLGLWAGIEWQERIVDAAAAQLGAFHQASRRIRQLTTGLAAARSLWDHRLPADTSQRLQILGPALGRMATTSGRSALDYAAGSGRAMPAAVFSSAARRLLRPGTARARLAQPGALAPAAVLERLNSCPPDSPDHPAGLLHADPLCEGHLDHAISDLIARGSAIELTSAAREQAGSLHEFERREWEEMGFPAGHDFNFSDFIEALQEMVDAREGLGRAAHNPYPTRPCSRQKIELERLSVILDGELSPHGETPFVARRVLATITGLGDQPLTPPELCLDFEIPAWKFLNEFAREWFLPGLGQLQIMKVNAAGEQVPNLDKDPVLAAKTNGLFSDAFLVGFNQQALAELRWRNVPVAAGCTPLRRFWEPIKSQPPPLPEETGWDIIGIHNWEALTDLGDPQHETPEAKGTNLVLVFKSRLWRRYPETMIYLLPQSANGEPNWPAAHIWPILNVEIGRDVVAFGFTENPTILNNHWVVIEQVLRDVNFYNISDSRGAQAMQLTSSALYAEKAFTRPVRVLIHGTKLMRQEP